MATTIVTKNSSTASAVPLAADLVQGELAVNVTDKRLFTENAAGAVVELGTTPSSVTTGAISGTTITASSTATFNGNTVIGNADTDTITQTASYVTGTQLKSAKTATNTLNLAAYDVDGAAYTNLVTLTASNTPTLGLTSTGVGTINNMSIGATTASTGAFTTLSATGNVTLGDAAADTVTVNGTTNFVAAPTIGGVGLGMGFKNRIINGAMMLDQRNAGASVTPASGDYTLDRYRVYMTQASKFTLQQNAGAVTPPVGYGFYLGCTSSSAYSILSTDYFTLRQRIEGFNFADMAWGTANAATVTVSFWVRSSLTGTFGGVLANSAGNRSYPFSYTISAANTWEQKTVTIAGDTTGTWIGATNGVGAQLIFSLGAGSTYLATANAWTASEEYGVTGQVNVVATNAATWYITGVQLEKGSTATSFDYRPYGTELALCQRYFEKSYDIGVAPASAASFGYVCGKVASNTVASTENYAQTSFAVSKRAQPTVTLYGYGGGSAKVSNYAGTDQAANTGVVNTAGIAGFNAYNNSGSSFTTSGNVVIYHWTAVAEL
jgi:hypothetical protein